MELDVALSPSWVNIDGADHSGCDAIKQANSYGPAAVRHETLTSSSEKLPASYSGMNSSEYIRFVYGDTVEDVRRRIKCISPFGRCVAVVPGLGVACQGHAPTACDY